MRFDYCLVQEHEKFKLMHSIVYQFVIVRSLTDQS